MTLCGWIILSERNLSDTIKPQLFLSSGGQALSVSYAFYMKSQFWFSTMHHYVQSVWENEVRLTYMHNKILTKFDQLANSTIINISVWHLKSGSILAHIRYNSNTRTEYRYWRLRPHPIFASTSYLCNRSAGNTFGCVRSILYQMPFRQRDRHITSDKFRHHSDQTHIYSYRNSSVDAQAIVYIRGKMGCVAAWSRYERMQFRRIIWKNWNWV